MVNTALFGKVKQSAVVNRGVMKCPRCPFHVGCGDVTGRGGYSEALLVRHP